MTHELRFAPQPDITAYELAVLVAEVRLSATPDILEAIEASAPGIARHFAAPPDGFAVLADALRSSKAT